jgi:hypothetical protein
MEKSKRFNLLDKAIKASKAIPDCIKTVGVFTWRIKDGKQLFTRYDMLETFPNLAYVNLARKDIFY